VGYINGGFSFVKNRRVTNYGGPVAQQSGTVYTLAQDSKGTIRAGTGRGVWRFDGSKWQNLGAEWDAPIAISYVGIDRTDTVWVIAGFSKNQKLLYLLPGSKRFQVANPKLDALGFTLDADRKVLTSPIALKQAPNREGIPQNELYSYPLFAKNGGQVVDRTNTVWTINESGGLTRIGAALPVSDGVTETGTKSRETHGVAASSQNMRRTLVDREGNIWYADEDGLHRFFYVPFIEQKLPVKRPAAIVAGDDGAVWVGYFMGPSDSSKELYRVTGSKRFAFAPRSTAGQRIARATRLSGLEGAAGSGTWSAVSLFKLRSLKNWRNRPSTYRRLRRTAPADSGSRSCGMVCIDSRTVSGPAMVSGKA
jgi:hypothetical protein